MYADPDQMMARIDSRIIGQLLSDDGSQVSEAAAREHPILLEALEDASGQIRSAALVGHKYTEANLETLARNRDAFLMRLTCDLALGFLYNRRQSATEIPMNVIRAEEWLAALRFGERILNVEENKTAGNPTNGYITDAVRSNLNLVSDRNRFFPTRTSRRTRSG